MFVLCTYIGIQNEFCILESWSVYTSSFILKQVYAYRVESCPIPADNILLINQVVGAMTSYIPHFTSSSVLYSKVEPGTHL